jgi:predicted transposase/invertase (TIGR01784 family)
MTEVVPLRFGVTFKRVFSRPEVFQSFASDILGFPITVNQVKIDYEYPEPIGFIRSRYDLLAEDTEQRIIVAILHMQEEDFFNRIMYQHMVNLVEQVKGFMEYDFERTVYTIVVLPNTEPQDGSVTFSYAHSDFSPVNEQGAKISVYPHRLVFLAPRLINANTPPNIHKWLSFIEDSLDGKMDATTYQDNILQTMLVDMHRANISPAELAIIKDEAAREKAKRRFAAKARADGLAAGVAEGRKNVIAAMIERGLTIEQIAEYTGIDVASIKQMRP